MNTDIATIQHRYRFTPGRLRLAALLMAGFIITVIWPVFELARLLLSGDADAFGPTRGLVAAMIATGFYFYAYWQMKRLAGPGNPSETGSPE